MIIFILNIKSSHLSIKITVKKYSCWYYIQYSHINRITHQAHVSLLHGNATAQSCLLQILNQHK
jgi:hypothetical protein